MNTITIKPGQTLAGIYGPDWRQASGYTGDPTKLAVGTVLPAPKTQAMAIPTAPAVKPLPTTPGPTMQSGVMKPTMPTTPVVKPPPPVQPPAASWADKAAQTVSNTIAPKAYAAENPVPLPSPAAATTQATAQAIQNGANPGVLERARQHLGEKAYIGLCQAFVEQTTQGKTGIYPSAIEAWRKQLTKAKTDMGNIQPGDAVYFDADRSNNGAGHTGVYVGNNQFISATYNGIRQFDLNDWMKSTGQRLLGYIPTGNNNLGSAMTTIGKTIPDWLQQRMDATSKTIQGFGKDFPNQLQTLATPEPSVDISFGTSPMQRKSQPFSQLLQQYSDMIRQIPV